MSNLDGRLMLKVSSLRFVPRHRRLIVKDGEVRRVDVIRQTFINERFDLRVTICLEEDIFFRNFIMSQVYSVDLTTIGVANVDGRYYAFYWDDDTGHLFSQDRR